MQSAERLIELQQSFDYQSVGGMTRAEFESRLSAVLQQADDGQTGTMSRAVLRQVLSSQFPEFSGKQINAIMSLCVPDPSAATDDVAYPAMVGSAFRCLQNVAILNAY